MNYKVFIAQEYDQKFKKFSKKDQELITKKMKEYVIPQIQSEPYFGVNIKKLKNYNPPTWRYRIGNYRIMLGFLSSTQPKKRRSQCIIASFDTPSTYQLHHT